MTVAVGPEDDLNDDPGTADEGLNDDDDARSWDLW